MRRLRDLELERPRADGPATARLCDYGRLHRRGSLSGAEIQGKAERLLCFLPRACSRLQPSLGLLPRHEPGPDRSAYPLRYRLATSDMAVGQLPDECATLPIGRDPGRLWAVRDEARRKARAHQDWVARSPEEKALRSSASSRRRFSLRSRRATKNWLSASTRTPMAATRERKSSSSSSTRPIRP